MLGATHYTAVKAGEFCSTRDAANLLGVSVKTVQLWVESGVLKAWKTPGRHRRIARESVQALLQQRNNAVPPKPVERSSSRFTILVVDDELHMRRLYELTISHWGLPIDLLSAKDGFEALIRIGERKPDMLITDLRMPGMDGFRMLEALRADSTYRSMQLIVVTALSRDEIKAHGDLPGHIAVLPKPIPFDHLRAAVERSLVAAA